VLYRGDDPIEGAAQALRMLNRKGYRYVFLTNGGGVSEKVKAKALGKKLGLGSQENVVGHRIIQSHTPKKGWPEHIKENDTILITGQKPHWVRQIARR
jgi:ribonucleotide monophosphatase NagD (HAD superfamily)